MRPRSQVWAPVVTKYAFSREKMRDLQLVRVWLANGGLSGLKKFAIFLGPDSWIFRNGFVGAANHEPPRKIGFVGAANHELPLQIKFIGAAGQIALTNPFELPLQIFSVVVHFFMNLWRLVQIFEF
jgi:hypothetical protein